MSVSLSHVNYSFGAQQVLIDVTAAIAPGERIGLIGPNGAGKTTLLGIISGVLTPDSGSVHILPNLRMGYLRQTDANPLDGDIEAVMRRALSRVFELEQELLEINNQMAACDPGIPRYRELEDLHHKAEDEFRSLDGYHAHVKISRVLTGLGFGSFDRATPVNTLSGGEYTRLMLCRLLVESPELLILDEATNHLDFSMLTWLEEFLAEYKGAILAVSHDRYFLNRITSTTWELEQGTIVRYPAPYGRYVALREERRSRLEKEFEAHQREVARLFDYAERNMARASTSASAKSRLRMIEHMGEAKRPVLPQKPPSIVFSAASRPVQTVLKAEFLSLSVENNETRRTLVDSLSFTVTRGERLAIVGPNGAGKSTLLQALTGSFKPDNGTVTWGRNVKTALFAQDAGVFSPNQRVIDALWDAFPLCSEFDLRSMLACLGLTGEDIYKKISMLSGGERARLKLAYLIFEKGNVLLLDEPTNHLDIDAREALESALYAFEGTILVVSHDRWLLTRLPTRILWVTGDGSFRFFEGGFDAMQQVLAQESPPPPPLKKPLIRQKSHRSRAARSRQTEKKQLIALLEDDIASAENELADVQNSLADPDTIESHTELAELTQRLSDLHLRLENLYSDWQSALDSSDQE
jgi:ATP-binding cassette subfamily F protein 3